jgi:hypothetical protein
MTEKIFQNRYCNKIRLEYIESPMTLLNTQEILQWNTGAYYTEHGQRIAAIEADGGVFMSDMDRGISYFFPDCPFYQSEIMRRYLYNENCKYDSPSVREFGQWELIDLMHKGQ